MFAKLITEKGSSDDYHAIEKAKSKRIEEMELLNSSNAKFILLKIGHSYS